MLSRSTFGYTSHTDINTYYQVEIFSDLTVDTATNTMFPYELYLFSLAGLHLCSKSVVKTIDVEIFNKGGVMIQGVDTI